MCSIDFIQMDTTKTRKTQTLKISFPEQTKPLYIDASSSIKPDYYNSVFSTIFERPATTTFSLRKTNDKTATFHLPKNDSFLQCENKNYYMSFVSKDTDIDKRFIELYKDAEPIPSSQKPDQILQFLMKENVSEITFYQPTIFLQRILTLSIIDIIKDKGVNQFTVSIVNSLEITNSNTLFSPDVIVGAFIDVIINVFGEACLWEDSSNPEEFPEFDVFIGLLVSLIIKATGSRKFLRKIIVPFCPSSFSESFIKALIAKLLTRLVDTDVFQIISEIFCDKWIINCFRTRELLSKFVLSGNNITILPYVGIFSLVSQWCFIPTITKMKNVAQTISCSLSQIGSLSLFVSKRTARNVIYPLLDSFYENELSFDIPLLEMTQEQKNRIKAKLETSLPILQETILKHRLVQLHTLDYIVKYMTKRRFEPKGLVLILFSFLYEKNIVHATVFNSWMTISPEAQGKYSALLEVNSFLMTLIPGTFPSNAKAEFLSRKSQK